MKAGHDRQKYTEEWRCTCAMGKGQQKSMRHSTTKRDRTRSPCYLCFGGVRDDTLWPPGESAMMDSIAMIIDGQVQVHQPNEEFEPHHCPLCCSVLGGCPASASTPSSDTLHHTTEDLRLKKTLKGYDEMVHANALMARSSSDRYLTFFSGGQRGGGIRPRRAGEARSPDGTRENSQNQGAELSHATIVPHGDAVADITRSEDKLNLMPGNALGTATPEGAPVCCWSTRKTQG